MERLVHSIVKQLNKQTKKLVSVPQWEVLYVYFSQ